jgi:hypothetical protein
MATKDELFHPESLPKNPSLIAASKSSSSFFYIASSLSSHTACISSSFGSLFNDFFDLSPETDALLPAESFDAEAAAASTASLLISSGSAASSSASPSSTSYSDYCYFLTNSKYVPFSFFISSS